MGVFLLVYLVKAVSIAGLSKPITTVPFMSKTGTPICLDF